MTILYSPYPADPATPAELLAIYNGALFMQRESYPALPWPMESLVGTTWINLHIGTEMTIRTLRPATRAFDGTDPAGWGDIDPYETSLGFWIHRKDESGSWVPHRYIIESWVRMDHWQGAYEDLWELVLMDYQRKCQMKMNRMSKPKPVRQDNRQLTLF